LQDSTFGLPFAGDAMVLVHRTATVSDPPPTFASALETQGPLAFPAADPQALFTLALYQAAGGRLFDDQGRPSLDVDILTEVLTFYQDGATIELIPFWLTQYETDEQSWEAFSEHLAEMVVTWTTRYLDGPANDTEIAHIPTSDGNHFTLGDGWVWALVSPTPEHQELSVVLAEYLTRSDFLAEWTSVTGYLPPRPSALADWEPIPMRSLIHQISLAAQLIPPSDVLTSLGPPLQEATVQVLKLEIDPLAAAEEAAGSLSGP
jgi:ABC-type glycerol-3-phosphate transport system substrate-binding protein